MKSKRKEVNKFKNKHQLIDSQQVNQEIIKRATGAKPFHLNKIRMQKKISEEFLNKKHALNIITDRFIKHNQNLEKGSVYLDLIVKKKLLIDGQKNVKLQSQRKSLLYLEIDQNDEHEATQFIVDSLNNDETELKNVNSQNLQAIKKQDFTNNGYKHKKSVSKCDCCHQMQGFSTQAIICKTNYLKDNMQPSSERSNSQHSLNVIDSKTELRNIIQKTSKSPFSFTNIKWRSKSELTVVDKWKQKYQKSNESSNSGLNKHKSVPKIIGNQLQKKQQFTARKRVGLQKLLKQKQTVTLPQINKQTQQQINLKSQQIFKSANKLQNIIKQKKGSGQKKYSTRKQIQPKITQPQRRNKVQSEALLEAQNKIVIKEMYTKLQSQNQVQPHQSKSVIANQHYEIQKQDTRLAMTKYQRQKNKKIKSLRSKFPQIKVSTFYSIKENDDQKKVKLHNLQRMISQSKIKPTKKIYFQKSLQQIPERWQYGQSREYSRQEVQHYLSIKKQEELRQMAAFQEQKNKQLELQEKANLEQIPQRKENIQAIQESLINRVV